MFSFFLEKNCGNISYIYLFFSFPLDRKSQLLFHSFILNLKNLRTGFQCHLIKGEFKHVTLTGDIMMNSHALLLSKYYCFLDRFPPLQMCLFAAIHCHDKLVKFDS